MTPPGEVRNAVARAIARGLGDDFDHAFATKAEWTQARGEKGGRLRDINEPMQGDYLDAADAALTAAAECGWALVPVEATEEMLQAAGATPNGVSPRGGIDWLGRMLPRYWAAMLAAAPKVGE